jgi:hypothetical protein
MEALLDECGDVPIEAQYRVVEILLAYYQEQWSYTPNVGWTTIDKNDKYYTNEEAILYMRREFCTIIAPLFLKRAKYWHQEMKISPFQRDLFDNRSKGLYAIAYHLYNIEYQDKLIHLAEAFFIA